MRGAIGVAMAMMAWALPALACLNDSDSHAAEEEFRSRYETPAPVAPVVQQQRVNHWGPAFMITGALMGTASVLVLAWRSRGSGHD